MNIYIPERLRPFSHVPGTQVLVPGSDWTIQVFPTLIKVQDVQIPLCKAGPVKGFTVQSDLERGCVWVWGTSPDGYFRLQIIPTKEGLILRKKKEQQLLSLKGDWVCNKQPERLFLGCHKAQDVDLARRRIHSAEIAPMLFLLGQKVPGQPADISFDSANFEESFSSFYLSTFGGLFCSHPSDPWHQGIAREQVSGNVLSGVYHAIRHLLIDGNKVLPHLPSSWISGKAAHLQTEFGRVDLEWRQGMVRRLFLHAEQAAPFEFAKPIRSFRTRKLGTGFLYDLFQK